MEDNASTPGPAHHRLTAYGPLLGGLALLERAINYTLGSLSLVTPGALANPTPCASWDLRRLLTHMNDSMLALNEAADLGYVDLESVAVAGDPVATLRLRACRMLGAWVSAARAAGGDIPQVTEGGAVCDVRQVTERDAVCGMARLAEGDAVCGMARAAEGGAGAGVPRAAGVVAVGGVPLTAAVVVGVGAVEVAVHGWDVARSCGSGRPVPASLAEELLELAVLFVTPADRPGRFAPPVRVGRSVPSSDRLVAYLGRHP